MTRIRRGIFVMDAIVGLVIIGALATAIAVALTQYRRADRRLSDTRTAARLCERTLVDLSAGLKPAADGRVKWQALALKDAPAGYAWIEVSATADTGRASLLGLVPASAAVEGKP
jgi:type II secretory pathway pseudopilin PulG